MRGAGQSVEVILGDVQHEGGSWWCWMEKMHLFCTFLRLQAHTLRITYSSSYLSSCTFSLCFVSKLFKKKKKYRKFWEKQDKKVQKKDHPTELQILAWSIGWSKNVQICTEIKTKDMFKKSTTNKQLGLFTTASSNTASTPETTRHDTED